MQPSTQRALVRALALILAVVAAAQILFYFCRTVDDMFISLRYAARLVAGDGLTYNDGARVEGFSNPSWVALQALLMALGVDGVVATKLLSLASYALLLFGVHRLGRETLGLAAPLALVGVVMAAASSYVASWAMWGLETPLYLGLLVWFMVHLERQARAPTRRGGLALAGVTVALLATRPEAPLYVVALGLAALVPRGDRGALDRLRALVPPALLAAAVVAGLLLWRYAYYGQWLPQTYSAKQGVGFDLGRLAPLVAQGASPLEVVLQVGAVVLAVALAVRARLALVAAVVLTNLFFVASVTVDWMPNQRHFLPLIVLAPLPWLWLVARLLPAALRGGRAGVASAAAVAVVAGLFAGTAAHTVAIDARFSIYDFRSHGRGQDWVRFKSARAIEDALDGLARTPPAHVAAMSPHHLGMIDQLFRVLEASAEPERETWFVGRDIGRVGYYSPVQVFDTAGLFTPALTASEAWLRDASVDADLVAAAFADRPVATDLLDKWGAAVGRERALVAAHDVLVGHPRAPVALRPRDIERPSAAEVLARYERVVDAFRAPFFQATLYGESVGAAVEKRFAWLAPQLRANVVPHGPPPAGALPAAPVALGGGQVELHGCTVEPAPDDAAGTDVVIACVWRANRAIREDWKVFVHLVDGAGALRAHGDHAPHAGLLPTSRWTPGAWVREAAVVPRPPPGEVWSARVGLFIGGRRMPARPGDGVDPDGRVVGPMVEGPTLVSPPL